MTGINEVIQSPLFGRQKKKLKKNQVKFLDDAIHKIMDAPELGEQKIVPKKFATDTLVKMARYRNRLTHLYLI